VEGIIFLTCILEVSGSNLSRNTDYPYSGFTHISYILQANPALVPYIRYSRHRVHRWALFRHNGFGIHIGRILQHAREFTLHYSGRRHADANVIRRFESLLRQTGIVIPTALANAGYPWILRTPANEDAITAAVGRT
jgi:hypothetical protein